MSEPHTRQLTTTGWTDWAGVRSLLGDDQCLWVDLGGVHHTAAPARLPVGATHLWSWRRDRWVRVRIDGDRVLAAVLTTSTGMQDVTTEVTVRDFDGLPWKQHSRAAEWEHPVTLVVTEGSTPITFVEVRPTSSERS